MSDKLQFKAFCFEMYKANKGMNGNMTQELFEKYWIGTWKISRNGVQ